MFFKTLSLLALIQVAVSTPPAAPLEVTTLSIFEPPGRTPGELYTVSFDVKDTGDQATTHCSVEWVYGTAVPGDYIPCADPGFAFKFKDYVRYFDFVLDVKHTNLQGTTVFADGAVLRDVNLFCKSASSGFTRCTQVSPPLTLEVYDVQS